MSKRHSNFEPVDGIHRPFAVSFEDSVARSAHKCQESDLLKWFYQEDISSLLALVGPNEWQEIELSSDSQKVYKFINEESVIQQKVVLDQKLGLKAGQLLLWSFDLSAVGDDCVVQSVLSLNEAEVSSLQRNCSKGSKRVFGFKCLEEDDPSVKIEITMVEGSGCVFKTPRFIVLG